MQPDLEHTINAKQIYDWLSTVTASEKMFFSYYQSTGENYSLEKLYEDSDPSLLSSIGMEANTDFRSIGYNYIQLKETMLFSETDWIHPFSDVAIHKHLRYFPAFFHHHSFFEVCYVISGNCNHTLRSADKTIPLKLRTGDILIIPPGTEHSILMNSDSIVVNILIRKSTFESALLNHLPVDTILYNFFLNTLYDRDNKRYILFHSDRDEQLIYLFFHMAETYCNNRLYANNIINQLLAAFFSIMLRDHSNSIEFAGEYSPCLELVPSILQYMDVNYSHTSIQDIAEHFGFNASYLGQTFKKSTGSTLIAALMEIRVSKARQLLETTSLSVDVISEMVGYEDNTHFIRMFKKKIGITPLQYRKLFMQA